MSSARLRGVVAAIVVGSGVASAAAQDDLLTVEDVVGLRRVTDAAIDPSGRRAVYVVSVPRAADDEPGSAYSELWIVDLDGGEPRRFTREGGQASGPRWSPDGTRIAFRGRRGGDAATGKDDGDEPGATQIHLIRGDGGEADVLTSHPTSVAAFRWSPDGSRIAFLAGDPKSDERKEAKASGRDWEVLDEEGPWQRLWLADVGTGEIQPAYDEPLHATDLAWTPDGRTLIAAAAGVASTDHTMMYSRLHRVTVAGDGDEPRPAPEVMTSTSGKLGSFAVAPDGAQLAFLGASSLNDPLPQSLFVTPIDGSHPRNLTGGAERSVERALWIAPGRLLEVANVGTRTALTDLDVESGVRRVVTEGGPVVRGVSLHAASGRLVAVGSGPDHPGELYAGSLEGGPLERRTNHNPHLAARRLARVETIEWRSRDGWRIEGVVTYPVTDEPGPHPLVVNPHGGPEGVTQEGFAELPQLLAARGFLVLQPNYRGSGGRGVAFSKGDHDDLGGREFQDILAGVDDLVRRGLADPERVGMGGWSYGGYLSAMAATHHSERFRAAVMGAGIANWVSFTGTTDIPDEMSIVHWNRPLQENVEFYWERSPLSAIDRAATPTLILFGAGDERVPPGQGRELYHALRQRDVATQMVLYPRAGHGVRERGHRVDLYERQLAWFDRYVR